MENFIVSARKYRPATFDSVVGQHSIVQTLKNAIRTNQIAQAFLFTGPRGVGKTTCARIFAKIINCENLRPDIEPCNECESCMSFNNNTSFNIIELDAASNSQVDQMRNLIDQVRIPPQHGKYKVYIIDEVHMLSSQAFNAFLKTLEEPPPYVKFILATTEKHKIIATILSRCQIYDFKRITVDDIVAHLKFVSTQEAVEAEPEALHVIALKADGAMRDSLSIFDQLVTYSGKQLTYAKVIESLNVLGYEDYFSMAGFLMSGKITEALLLLNDIIERGFEGQSFLNGLGEHFRNLWLCKDPASVKLLEASASIRQMFTDQSAACSLHFLYKALNLINQCDINYRTSNNRRLLLEITLINLCNIGSPIPEEKPTSVPPPSPKNPSLAKSPDIAYQTPPPAPLKVDEPAPPKDPVNIKLPAAATQAGVTTARPASQSGTSGHNMLNLKGIINPAVEKPKEEEFLKPDPDKIEVNLDFTEEELVQKWNLFIDSLDETNLPLIQALKGSIPRLTEDKTVELEVINLIIEKDILDQKEQILEFLRRELSNRKIRFKTILEQTQTPGKAYAPKDKYQQMVEKKPELAELIKRLDLELDL
jgi:DNA polymerase-3 subunit gamma/tau